MPASNTIDIAGFDALASALVKRADWNHPSLRSSSADSTSTLHDSSAAAAQSLVHLLRARSAPDLGFASDYIQHVRLHATPAFHQKARSRIDELLRWNPQFMRHFGLSELQPEMILVEATTEDHLRLARDIAEHRADWDQCDWGCSHTIFRYVQTIWRDDRCPDEALVPVLAWLLHRIDAEWTWARHWAEDMLGCSGHNWWVCQFAGLWKAAVFLPEFQGLRDFRAMAEQFLEREVDILFSAEGLSREGSLMYHLVTSVIQDWARLAELNHITLSPRIARRLRDMADLEAALLTPDGVPPALGDSAAPWPRRYWHDRLWHWAALFPDSASGTLVHQLRITPDAPEKRWSGYFLLTCVGQIMPEPVTRASTITELPLDHALVDSGLYVMRSRWSDDADHLLIDAMPKGDIGSSHAHDGLMHLTMHCHGTPVLVDRGGGWQQDADAAFPRVHAKAHNVATVNDVGHCKIRAMFRFARHVRPFVDGWVSQPAFAYFSGVHEAYATDPEIAVAAVRRKVFYLRNRYAIVLDRFTTIGNKLTRKFTQHFHLGLPVKIDCSRTRCWTQGPTGNALLIPVRQQDKPVTMALNSPHDDEDPATNPHHLSLGLHASTHTILATVIVPFQGTAMPHVDVESIAVHADHRELSPWEATGLRITRDGVIDTYVDFHMAWTLPWHAGEHRGDRRLFHSDARIGSQQVLPPQGR